MAPLTDAQRDAAMRRWAESHAGSTALERSTAGEQTSNNYRRRDTPSGDGTANVKNNRNAQAGPPSSNNKTPGNFGKGKFGGGGGPNIGKGFKSGGNANDDKDKGNSDNSSKNNNSNNGNGNGNNNGNGNGNNNSNNKGGNSNKGGNGNSDGSKSSNTNNAGTSGDNGNTGNNGNSNSSNGNGNSGGSATTTTAATGGGDGSSDSNGAQQFSSDSVDETTATTDASKAAATTSPPTTVVLTTSTIVTSGPSGSDDKKHKGVNGTTTDDDNNNNKGNNNNNNSNNKGNNNNNSNSGSNNGSNNNNNNNSNKNSSSSKSLDPTAERALISVGSIGPMMASNVGRSQMARDGGPAFNEKGGDTLRTFGFESDLPPAIPPQVYYSGGLGLGLQFQPQAPGAQQADASSVNRMPAPGLMRSNSGVSGVSAYTHSPAASFSSSQISAQSVVPAAVPYGASSAMINNRGQPTGPVMVVNGAVQQYLTDDLSSATGTMRSRMPDPFYNQSQLARQPSDAYDPARRQVNRVSELSSLSSGFGDGEILVLPSDQQQTQASRAPMAMPRASSIPTGPPPAASSGAAGRFSWMRKQRMSRDTVYTEASEDQPAKFRSVNSWVNQQTGRVRRGQASIDTTTSASAAAAGPMAGGNTTVIPGDEPGIPHPMPEEQRLTMMMDDEEVPRHPDTVPGIQMT
ncbi:hypothetical protein SCUCBS95973_004640 [Sporothrix curviconia]|uniref:Uncharacterized protein n=1 Tax=Sporothrix curviconia TaxID=1260050 RepID=A0ABP0BQQ2_9PEZI